MIGAGNIELDLGEPVLGIGADLAVVPLADRHRPLADVSAGADIHPQTVARILMNNAPVRAHQHPPLRFGKRENVDEAVPACIVFDAAGIGLHASRKAVEQCRLAGAGLADDADDFAGIEREGNVFAGGDVAECLGNAGDAHQRRTARC